jgi:diguanylate cyclase (GGDEF)-like protein/PAS domain S-box-containing protein
MTHPVSVSPDVAVDTPTLDAVIESYPGPALRLSSGEGVLSANAVAAEMLEADGDWLPVVGAWVTRGGMTPGLRSVPLSTAHGTTVIEWAATPLPDGGTLLLGRDSTLERQLRHTLTESRLRYKDLVEASSDFAWETGPDGRFVFVTPRGALGFDAEALIGRDPRELAIEEWGDLPLPFDTRRRVEQSELWLKTADAAAACVVASAIPLFDSEGAWCGARGVCRDVTEQALRSHELTRARNRERLLAHIVHTLSNRLDAAEAMEEAAMEMARALGADGCRIFRQDEDGGMTLAAAFGESEREVAGEALQTILDTMLTAGHPIAAELPKVHLLAARTEYRRALNGAVLIWRGADAEGWDEEDVELMAGLADQLGIAHAQLAYQDRLRRLSERDGLTGLFNRRTFYERLEEALARPDGGPSALLYVDLDNFKAVNDVHGHRQGDAALRAVAQVLVTGVRPGDIAGRVGGDEFVLWLGRADADKAEIVARRLLTGVAGLQHLAAPDRPLGLSIGIAVRRPGQGDRAQELADRADHAMYAAKQAGKNTFAVAPERRPARGEETLP